MKNQSKGYMLLDDKLFWQNKELSDLPNEIWVSAYGYEGAYSVSNLGRVKSEERRVPTSRGDRRVRARILSQAKSSMNRLSVSLSIGNVAEPVQVNQLVYYSFNPHKIGGKDKSEVYHKNKIEWDNRLANLGHNKIKGTSYAISIKLGNVKHLDAARKQLSAYSKDTAVIENGKTTHRKCTKCDKLKAQGKYEKYGMNVCRECSKKMKKEAYVKRLKAEGKDRIRNKVVVITDTVTGEKWISSNKAKCIISKQQINKYANTGEYVKPYRNSKHKNPLLIEITEREE